MANCTIHPTSGHAVLADAEMRRVEGSEAGVQFTVQTSGLYSAGQGWQIEISVAGVNNNAPIRFIYSEALATGMIQGEQLGRKLAGEWAAEWSGE